uniref:Centrosomal protein CEP104 Zn finger domain-containing protein n=1 Tax=Hucho hucho TaxID=62062 RepID=A0A4W5KRW8_9TELE
MCPCCFAGVKKAPQNNPADAGDDQSSVVNHLDNLCIFCGDKDESFTEDELDLHYWKHCPMLRRCDQCRQVRKWQSGSKLDLNGPCLGQRLQPLSFVSQQLHARTGGLEGSPHGPRGL